ncbi:MAG: type I phosphomannose isomerase catalytic subunit [Anaerolineales bacterium]
MYPFRLLPEFRERVWGGQRLKPDSPKPVGEAWIVYEQNQIAAGRDAGRTLGALAAAEGERLLGKRVMRATGLRFPLLIKLLDCEDWLSVQVHPNDEQAVKLEGPGHFGKTEAWHILEAQPEARLIAGLQPGTSPPAFEQAVRGGTLDQIVHYINIHAGDTVMMRAGTLHALGPGLLLYEIQQTSDLTYRVFDWNRPASAGRELHLEKSLAVTDVNAVGRAEPLPALRDGAVHSLTMCEYFRLDALQAETQPIALDTLGESFHALTVTEGRVQVEGEGWIERLGRFETLIVPAACDAYAIKPLTASRVLKANAG